MIYLAKTEVPLKIWANVQIYLDNRKLGNVVHIQRMSNHPDDKYLFGVIAEKNEMISCWTCWNETTQSLNFGHYGIKSLEEAFKILDEFYNDCREGY